MKYIMNGFLGLCFLIGAAYVLGVRIHPEALNGGKSSSPQNFMKIQMTNGTVLSGAVTEESAKGLTIMTSGMPIPLSNREIKSKAPLSEEEITPDLIQESMGFVKKESLVTYRSSDSLLKSFQGNFAQKNPVKRPVGNAAALWGSRPHAKTVSVPASDSRGIKTQPGSMIDIYKKSMSAESLESWKNESIAQLNATRNPFFAARDAAQAKKSGPTADTSKSEAKLRELEEHGL